MIADEPHVVVHLNRFRQYPETGMEYLIMTRKNAKSVSAPITQSQFNADVIKSDPTTQLLELLRGLNPTQLQLVLAQLAPVAPVAVAPVAVAPVAPVAVAPVAPVTLPTAITRDLGAGTLTTELLCIGVSPVRWGYGKPTRIVNFVHEHENIGFVSYENGTETDFRPGVRYAITATLPGKLSKEYQGVQNNIMKIATSVAI